MFLLRLLQVVLSARGQAESGKGCLEGERIQDVREDL